MKVATIGAGGIAERHLGVLGAEPEIEIAGHVTTRPRGAQEAAQRWGGRAYTDFTEMLDREEVDAVWVCVPPGAHGAIEHELIERGIPFFVEKPLSVELHTAEEIAQRLDRTGIVAAVGYHMRAMDTLPEVQRTLAENPARMVLGAWHDSTPPPEWWRRQASSGGQMVEQATHLFDLARVLVGEATVIGATATRHERPAYPDADVATVSAALLRYETDATGVFTATCLLGGAAAVHVQLVCEGLLITVARDGVTYDTGVDRREVRVNNDPFVDEDRAFLSAVRNGDPSLCVCKYRDALVTHRLCCEARRAAGDGR